MIPCPCQICRHTCHSRHGGRKSQTRFLRILFRFQPIDKDGFSLRIIAILEQNQRRTRKISSTTAPHPHCPLRCRLRAGLWPPRMKVGYGYHLAHFGACWGDFQRAKSKAGERSGVVPAPTPVASAHSAGSCGRSVTGVAGRLFRQAVGSKTEKVLQLREKLRGHNYTVRSSIFASQTTTATMAGAAQTLSARSFNECWRTSKTEKSTQS